MANMAGNGKRSDGSCVLHPTVAARPGHIASETGVALWCVRWDLGLVPLKLSYRPKNSSSRAPESLDRAFAAVLKVQSLKDQRRQIC